MKSNMHTIQFDLDGVLADFTEGFTEMANKSGYKIPVVKTVDQRNWSKFEGLGHRDTQEVWKRIGESHKFWLYLNPLVDPYVFQQIDELSKYANVYFVTARHTGIALRQQTYRWLANQGIVNPTILFASKKYSVANDLGVHYSIEDNLENAVNIGWYTPAFSYILDRPYNRVEPIGASAYIRRVNTVGQFLVDAERGLNEGYDNGRASGVARERESKQAETRGMQAA